MKPLKPFSLKFMAAEKSARKGGRKHRGETSRDLPDDLSELYKTDPEEDYISARHESNEFDDIGQNSGSSTGL